MHRARSTAGGAAGHDAGLATVDSLAATPDTSAETWRDVPAEDGQAAAATVRSTGLDVLRGLVVLWLLVVVYTPTLGLRGHAAWFGWDHSDVFFPMFVLVAGMGWRCR